MTSYTQPHHNSFTYNHKQFQKPPLSHKQQLQLTIRQQLDRCEQIYSTKMQGIVQEWKKGAINNYRQIIEKVDKSLIDQVNRIICEQIHIEKEQIIQLISQMGKEILKNTKQPTKQHVKQQKTIQMGKSKEKSYSLLKTRSISNQNSRRKLSKGSFFAQAKKINMNQTINSRFVAKTNPLSGFNNNERDGGKVKKVRRKEESCFDLLQKANKTTSPSNIMINYINAKEAINSNQPEHYNHEKTIQQKYRIQVNNKEVFNQNIENTNISTLITPIQNSIKVQSQTYKKLMINFQEKISKKLDVLMDKYTKIQQRLQTNTQKPVQSIIYNRNSQAINENVASIEASMVNLPEKSIYAVQKEKIQEIKQKPNIESKRTGKENDQNKTKHMKQQQLPRKSVKAIEHHNKIVKNKSSIIQNFAQSLEQISLQKQKPTIKDNNPRISAFKNIEKESKQRKQQQALLSMEKQLKEKDKFYLQTLIMDFFKVTQKVILPISKQLLYVLVYQYQEYCEINSISNRNKEIMGLQTKKLEVFQQEFVELLNKIQKVIDSKCQPSKKEKLIMYFSKFIQAASSYDTKNNKLVKENEERSESELKEKINQIKISLAK